MSVKAVTGCDPSSDGVWGMGCVAKLSDNVEIRVVERHASRGRF